MEMVVAGLYFLIFVHFLIYIFRLSVEEQMLPVASNLPPGYLSVQPLGLGKGVKVHMSVGYSKEI